MENAHGYGKNTSNVLENLPAGYRFKPTNEELVENYLINKVLNNTLPPNNIKVVDLYKFHPRVLSEMYKQPHRETEYYFFTSRNKKYPNGSRPNRVVGDDSDPCGHWKASGADINIYSKGKLVGYKKVLAFYEAECMPQTSVHDQGDSRKRTREKKTRWIMYEFRVAEEFLANAPPRAPNDKKLDSCVLCMIYEHNKGEKETNNQKSDLRPQLKLAGPSQNDQDTAMVNNVPVPILPTNNDMLIHILSPFMTSPFMTSPPYLDSSSCMNLPQGNQMIGHENIHYQQQFGHVDNVTVQQQEFGHVQLPDLLPNPQCQYIDPFEAALYHYLAYSDPRQEEEAKPKIQDEEAKPGVNSPDTDH